VPARRVAASEERVCSRLRCLGTRDRRVAGPFEQASEAGRAPDQGREPDAALRGERPDAAAPGQRRVVEFQVGTIQVVGTEEIPDLDSRLGVAVSVQIDGQGPAEPVRRHRARRIQESVVLGPGLNGVSVASRAFENIAIDVDLDPLQAADHEERLATFEPL